MIEDRDYRGCEHVKVCKSKEDLQTKAFNSVSRWRKGVMLLAYLYAYAIGYSFFRKSHVLG